MMQPSILLGPPPPFPDSPADSSPAGASIPGGATSFIPDRAPSFARRPPPSAAAAAASYPPGQRRSAGSDFIHVDRSNNRRIMAGKLNHTLSSSSTAVSSSSSPSGSAAFALSLLAHPDVVVLLQIYLFKLLYLALRIAKFTTS
ncbi:hypothetical protein Dda_1923 [Drechslerella dactyloides]|uniref:Uncharacterized protein n=1 Tax=Drechslerella dactyloides TaxID=74499 RepID=A0AAD6J2Y1_DREDA|nr:hypothetical protein Dda_1923 [Drechslerella dactyloides]